MVQQKKEELMRNGQDLVKEHATVENALIAYDLYRNFWSIENMKRMYLAGSEYAAIAD